MSGPRFRSGKFAGQLMEAVATRYPEYILWCYANVGDHFGVPRELYERARAAVAKKAAERGEQRERAINSPPEHPNCRSMLVPVAQIHDEIIYEVVSEEPSFLDAAEGNALAGSFLDGIL